MRDLKPFLTAPPDVQDAKFRNLNEPRDVADLLELSWSQLHFITSRSVGEYEYRRFAIPKRAGGERQILAPVPTVMILQRKLLGVLEHAYRANSPAHGFVRDRSILTNAQPHASKHLVLNIDLENFFPTITFPRVRGMFIRRFGFDEAVATVLTRICCNTGCVPDHLPQGAPTSPIVSNMICHSLDRQLLMLARSRGLYYTRYADDLTFSSTGSKLPDSVAIVKGMHQVELGPELTAIIQRAGFSINESKTRLLMQTRDRQIVTGLVVNEFPNVQRTMVREIRAMIHAWQKFGLDAVQDELTKNYDSAHTEPDFRRVLSGKLSFVRSIRGSDNNAFRRLYGRVRKLDPGSFPELPPLTKPPASLRLAVRDFPVISNTDSVETRREYLGRVIGAAQGTLWILDPHLERLPADIFERVQVSQVRLLSTKHVNNSGAKEAYIRLRDELAQRSITLEWKRAAPSHGFHDRWVIDDFDCISLGGSLNGIVSPSPSFGQNIPTTRPTGLADWWEDGSPQV